MGEFATPENADHVVNEYKVIVTYNGKTFDIPFIERYFGIKIPHAQLDLRYILYSLGYSGGLKSCERQSGIGRTGSLADVDGFFAVLLWNDYTKKAGSCQDKNLLRNKTLLLYSPKSDVYVFSIFSRC